MSLTKAKVLSGPFTITGYDALAAEVFEYSGLKSDALVLNTEDEINELEDFTTELVGRHLTAEATISELNTTDLDAIESAATVEIAFPNKGKVITIAPDEVRPKVDNGKTKIIMRKFAAGDTWPFTKGDIPEPEA